MADELETVDLPGVEIMASGGPIHGIGSPPEGDSYTTEDLRRFVDAATDLADAGLKPPAKIGHEATAPRVGWLDKIRLSDAGDTIVADIRDVPKKFAALVKAGAYRARSPEFYKITSQKTGTRHEAIGALAWLGGRRPAIQKLSDFNVDEVFALYEEMDAEFLRAYEFDNPDQAVPERLLEAVLDLAAVTARAISATPPILVRMADSKYTDEQRRAFQDALGLEPDKVTDEVMAAAGVTVEGEPPEPAEETRALEEQVQELTKRAADAAASAETSAEKLRLYEQSTDIEQVIRDGKEVPGRREELVTVHDKLGHDDFVKFYESARVDETLVREYGSDEEGTDEPTEEQTRALEDELESVFPGYKDSKVTA